MYKFSQMTSVSVLVGLLVATGACGSSSGGQSTTTGNTSDGAGSSTTGGGSNNIPCECPATWILDPVSVELMPVPSAATVSVKATSADSSGGGLVEGTTFSPGGGTCQTTEACGSLKLGVDFGTYSITIDANGFTPTTQSVTFARVPSDCCPGLTPMSIKFPLTAVD